MSHIVFVIPTLDRIAGAEGQLTLLAKGLANRNWRVTVIALSGSDGGSAAEIQRAGIAFHSLEMRKGLADPRGWIRFHTWLRRQRPDILHAHLPHAAWLARWSRLFAPVPVVIDTLHTSSTGTLGRRIGYRLSNWLPDRVSAVSMGVAEAHRAARMVSDQRLLIVPNGIDVRNWRPDSTVRQKIRTGLGIAHKFICLAAGRLEPVKDYPSLLWAMSEVPRTAHLVIAGAGPAETGLRRLVSQYGLEPRVRFLGFEPHMLPWMQAADAFVLSSRWEGLPTSLLEAGACALPSAVTDVPGSREIVVHEHSGFLAPAGNALALRQAIVRMMRLSADERAAMGDCARRHICRQFSLDAVLDRWEALYHDLLPTHPGPARWGRLSKTSRQTSRLSFRPGGGEPVSVPATTPVADKPSR